MTLVSLNHVKMSFEPLDTFDRDVYIYMVIYMYVRLPASVSSLELLVVT